MVICDKCTPDIIPQILDFGSIEVFYCDHINILNKKPSDKFTWISVQNINKKENKKESQSCKN